MAESALSTRVMKVLRRYGHAVRVENMVGVGHPDVNYCIQGREGHIENKWRSGWPRDPNAPVTLDHFTSAQRIWIGDRIKAGGTVWVVLAVAPHTIVLPGIWAAVYLGEATRAEILAAARAVAVGSLGLENFIQCIIGKSS